MLSRKLMILRYVLFAAALSATPVQPPPLFDNLGNHHHPISTNITGVQRYSIKGCGWFTPSTTMRLCAISRKQSDAIHSA